MAGHVFGVFSTGRFPITDSDKEKEQFTKIVRRPTSGTDLKKETFATMRVTTGENKNLKLIDAGSRVPGKDGVFNKRYSKIYSNFLLQSIREERTEKSQIIESFGEPYLFLYGERPRIMNFQGILLNTFDFNWEAEWWYNYDTILRGTKCLENKARIFLSFDNTLVSGYILASSAEKTATERSFATFQFQLFVTAYSTFSDIGNPSARTAEAEAITDNLNTLAEAGEQESTLKWFRPTLITPGSTTSTRNLTLDSDGNVKVSSLERSLQTAVGGVLSSWNRASQLANSAFSNLNSLQAGTRVRVPVGYAGALAFDNIADENAYTVKTSGAIQFGYHTFADNTQEYVGASSHYGSASTTASFVNDLGLNKLGYETVQDKIQRGQELVEKAKKIWKKYGIDVPDTEMGTLSRFAIAASLGVLSVGGSRAWMAATVGTKTLQQTGDPEVAAIAALDNLGEAANNDIPGNAELPLAGELIRGEPYPPE